MRFSLIKNILFGQHKSLICLILLLSAAIRPAASFAQYAFTQAFEDVVGTYTLTFALDPDTTLASPVADGARVTFVVASASQLCTDDLSLGAGIRIGNPTTAISWRNDLSDVRFDLNLADVGGSYTLDDIEYRNAGGQLLGIFTLTDVSDYTNTIVNCRSGSDPTIQEIDDFLDHAEASFPELFPPGPFTFTQQTGSGSYRYYDSTSIYLTVSAGQVSARGGAYGQSSVMAGNFDNLVNSIGNMIRPASIPENFTGTYRAVMSDTQPFSAIVDGAEITYAINAGGQLCLSTGASLSNPLILDNNTDLAIWRDITGNFRYGLDVSMSDVEAAEALLQVYSGSGQRYGELAGEKVSLDINCDTLDPAHPDNLIMNEIERLFELAEQLYPEYVPVGPTVRTLRTSTYTYRYYPATNVFIAVRDGLVYTDSGMPNFIIPTMGTLNNVFNMLGQSTRDFAPAPSLVGTYEVLVSEANPLFSLPNNSRIRLVIAAGGALCIDNITLQNPTTLRTSPSSVSWTNTQAGINAFTTLTDEVGTISMVLSSTRGENLATLEGDRINLLASCPQPMMNSMEIDAASLLFALAELRYPDLLDASAGSTSRSTSGAYTRFYPASGVTVSVSLNEVFIRGAEFGDADFYVGTVNNLTSEFTAGPPDQAAVLPATLPGTYNMLVSDANPFAPFSNNSQVRMVISGTGDLCLDNTFTTNPRSSFSAPNIARWSNSTAGFHATLNMLQSGGQLTMPLVSAAGNTLGTLTGARISAETFCSGVAPDAALMQQLTSFFALAEQRFPGIFPAGSVNVTNSAGGAVIRRYPAAGTTITVAASRVYMRGGDFGAADFYSGTLPALSSQWKAELDQQNATVPYTVQVSGTATVSIAGSAAISRNINIVETRSYNPAQLADSQLPALAASLLSGEIQSPTSTNIQNVVRNNGSLSFTAQLVRTTVVGSSTTRRTATANFLIQAQ